jgi:hypothetical protein
MDLREAFVKVQLETPSVTFQLHFSDDSSTHVATADEVLAEENPRSKSIVGLDIDASGSGNHVIFQIGENGGAFSVEGPQRDWVYITSSVLDERLRRMRLPYLRSPIMGWAVAMLGALLALRLCVYLSERMTLGPWLVYLIGALFIAGFGFSTSWLFPSPVFQIGSGIRRQETVQKVRLAVLGALFGAVVFRLFYDLIIRLWGNPLDLFQPPVY